ncbi:queuosine precursor transporter [Roseospirillum parvum]|uniref:Probable queuosine precursor transporter n=1 Tax=Roseospirillum parvum TaxID=83401 RepID=A0A1G7WH03_9PROT|nr:queuosine precursor transporter [Roseospirillum parvum]SDG71263.1 hypothetical protein SAMN05421742_102197 [Roseospirillum parvum]
MPTIPRPLILPVLAMMAVVTASNILVQYPINDLLTWGAFTYPVAFLVTDLTNRHLGPVAARRVVLVGFALAVVLSIWLATPRIAVASGSAFLAAQMLDVQVFDRLRRRVWWLPPLVSSLIGSGLDTAIFFSLAFTGLPGAPVSLLGIEMTWWVALAIGDFGVKLALALTMLLPFRALAPHGTPRGAPGGA